jgi:hypothetical protein
MIRGYNVIANIAANLAANTTIATWATTNYGRRQVVRIGWDHQREPADADCPLIVLRPLSDVGGPLAAKTTTRLLINLALYEARCAQSGTGGARVPECLWVTRMHSFAEYTWAGIKTAWAAADLHWPIATVTLDYDDSLFPLVQAAQTITVEALQCLGAAEPSL